MASAAEEGKFCALLMYLIPIVGIIWYFADEKMKNNTFAKFHLKQGLVLVILMVAGSVINVIPLLGQLASLAAFVIGFVGFVQGIINTLGGKEKEVWLVGQFGKKFNF